VLLTVVFCDLYVFIFILWILLPDTNKVRDLIMKNLENISKMMSSRISKKIRVLLYIHVPDVVLHRLTILNCVTVSACNR